MLHNIAAERRHIAHVTHMAGTDPSLGQRMALLEAQTLPCLLSQRSRGMRGKCVNMNAYPGLTSSS